MEKLAKTAAADGSFNTCNLLRFKLSYFLYICFFFSLKVLILFGIKCANDVGMCAFIGINRALPWPVKFSGKFLMTQPRSF